MPTIAVATVVLVLVFAGVLAVASYRRHSDRARRASAAAWLTLQLEADALRTSSDEGSVVDPGELPQEPDGGTGI